MEALNLVIGSKVEVSSDEEGFRGAWYVATILKSPSSSSSPSSSLSPSKVFVEYDSLLAQENGSALLRESVDLKFVRPVPPVDRIPVQFKPGDLVDAYYQDGWWSGVITMVVHPHTLYKVFFSNPPDELLFNSADLRIHRTWISGLWLRSPRPDPQIIRDYNFSPGTAVEVNLDAHNSQDVWFPAKVVREVCSTVFLVEYQTTTMPGLQKVGVDCLHIRPPPPITTTKAFTLLEKVDALCDFCWLTGIVTKILAAGRYIVYFKHTRKEKELCLTDLRVHMEWTNGKWFHSSQDTSMASKSEKQSVYLNGGNQEDSVVMKESNGHVRIAAVRLSEKDPQTTTSGRADNITITPTNERNKQTNANGNAISVRRSRRSTEEAVSDAMLSPQTCNPNINQTEVLNTGTSLAVDTSMPDHQAKSSLEQSEDAKQPSDPTDIEGDYEKLSVTRKEGSPLKLEAQVAGSIQLEAHVETAMEETSTISDSLKPLPSPEPIVIDLTDNSSGPLLKKKKTILHEKQLDASANCETPGEPHKAGEVINVKRKRGRPHKSLPQLGNPKTTEAESEENVRQDVCVEGSSVTPSRTDQVENSVANDKLLQINTSAPTVPPGFEKGVSMISDISKQVGLKTSKRSTGRRRAEKHRKNSIEATMEPDDTLILRGKKLKSINQAELPTEDNSRGEAVEDAVNGVGSEDNTAVAVTSSNASDDQPLSAWLEGPHSPATYERDSMDWIVGQFGETENEMSQGGQSKGNEPEEKDEMSAEPPRCDNDSSERRDETPTIECTTIVDGKDEELPFIKNSVIWEMIESMDILKVVPQKPHFRPLYKCKEECREGLAIGRMVTFTSIAEKISKARFEDPERMFQGYGEALGELEEHGFEIIGVRERLEKLISIKRRHDEDAKKREPIERQIREREEERAKMEEEIEEAEKEIEELKEKQRRIEWRKEKKEAERRANEATVEAVKGVLAKAQQEFDKLASSFLQT